MNYLKKSFYIPLILGISFGFVNASCKISKVEENLTEIEILHHPENLSVTAGEPATFQITAISTDSIRYQWYKNDESIVDETDSVLIISETTLNDNGSVFRVEVSVGIQTLLSEPALLTVNQIIPDNVAFTTEGSSFAPLIELTTDAEVLWTWSDGTTSNSLNPEKNFGSNAKRVHTLKITPWSAVKSVIIGYDGLDGGSSSIPKVADQKVSKVERLEKLAPYLQIWCSSYNLIPSLDFSNFIQLHTIECFESASLQEIKLANTPSLKRLCVEECDLLALDVSESPQLKDIRGAVNKYTDLNFGTIGAQLWHICIRDNPQITVRNMFEDLSIYPKIKELYIWNCNQTGKLRLPFTDPDENVEIQANSNSYTNVDLSGSLQGTSKYGLVTFQNNEIESINISGCVQINKLDLRNNKLSQAEVDEVLATLDALGRSRANTPASNSLYLNLSGNAEPGSQGIVHANNLVAKGWTVIAQNFKKK